MLPLDIQNQLLIQIERHKKLVKKKKVRGKK